jgi:hypothetical protein
LRASGPWHVGLIEGPNRPRCPRTEAAKREHDWPGREGQVVTRDA